MKQIETLHDKAFPKRSFPAHQSAKERKTLQKARHELVRHQNRRLQGSHIRTDGPISSNRKQSQMQPVYTSKGEVNMDCKVYIAAHRMVDLHWTAQQVADEFKAHHQKTWCSPFRKYQSQVEARMQPRGATAAAWHLVRHLTRIQPRSTQLQRRILNDYKRLLLQANEHNNLLENNHIFGGDRLLVCVRLDDTKYHASTCLIFSPIEKLNKTATIMLAISQLQAQPAI
ncbi:MAG: hypothetical protein U0103_25360 [Candidatus Obscuribacterales bacterium]